jgi:hypothetical protein
MYTKASETDGIAQIVKDDGSHVGMAIVVDGGYIITCAHVINQARGKDDYEINSPGKDVAFNIRFRFPTIQSARACVVKWGLTDPRDGIDLALLKPVEPIPADVGRAVFRSCKATGMEWTVFGQHQQEAVPAWTTGAGSSVVSKVGDDLIQLNGVGVAGRWIDQGDSGAKVWCRGLGAAIGVVVTKHRHSAENRISGMIPTTALRAFWPVPLARRGPLQSRRAVVSTVAVLLAVASLGVWWWTIRPPEPRTMKSAPGSYEFSKKLLERAGGIADPVLKSLLIAEAVLQSKVPFPEGEEAFYASLMVLPYQEPARYRVEFDTIDGSRAAFSQDGSTLAVAGGADLWVFDLKNQSRSRFAARNLSSLRSIALSHSGSYIAGVTHGTNANPGVAYIWRCRTNGVLHGNVAVEVDKIEHIDTHLVNQTIAFGSNDILFVVTDDDRLLKVHPADTGLQRTTLPADGNVLGLSPNGAYVAVKEKYEGQSVLSIKTTGVGDADAESVGTIPLLGYSSEVQFSSNGDFIVLRRPLTTPSTQVWEISRKRVLAEVNAATFHFKQMRLTPDGRQLAVLDTDGNATCYELPNGTPYAKLTEVLDICFSADGKYRALVKFGGKVIAETAQPPSARRLPRDLTAEEWDVYIGSEVPYRKTREALLNRN